MGRTPKVIYESLPYVYVTFGLIVTATLRSFMGVSSGLLLISSGIVVWAMRRNFRRALAANAQYAVAGRGTRAVDDKSTSALQMVWRSSFDVGHEGIDKQHRRLFSLGNELIDAILTSKPEGDVELLLDELINDIEGHFRSEEDAMVRNNTALPEAHIKVHRSILSTIKQCRDRYHHGFMPAGELVGFIAYDVISQHIVNDELKFSSP